MIYNINGEIIKILEDSVILKINKNIQLQVFTNINNVSIGENYSFYIHIRLRENLIELYGFVSLEEKEFFQNLLKINGISEKIALLISSKKDEFFKSDNKLAFLKSIKGIGEKTAIKVVKQYE